jgi:hypothetical protein
VSLPLPPGLIFEIADQAGLELRGRGDKRTLRCPLHSDEHPSAFVSRQNVFYCSRCTPEKGLTAKEFAGRLGVSWDSFRPGASHAPATRPRFDPAGAAAIWDLALARARDDDSVEADREVYDYLGERHLLAGWETGAFGILSPGPALPPSVASWPGRGYRVVAPLYGADGELHNVQARNITGATPKTRVPKGSQIKSTVFASDTGLSLLRGEVTEAEAVVLAEGLTDYLALVAHAPCPVLSAPGAGMAASSIGPWAAGRTLFIATDADHAGEDAAEAAAETARRQGARRVVRIDWAEGCKDACDVLGKFGEEAFAGFLHETIGSHR